MEFHLPYFALRNGPRCSDPRRLRKAIPILDVDSGGAATIRNSTTTGTHSHLFLYEAQISLLLVGVDEYFWTVYCSVDTFFGSEQDPSWYAHEGQDAPSGAGLPASLPIWTPRGYFLFVLSRRVNQITNEWRNILSVVGMDLINQNETVDVSESGRAFFDDEELTRTKRYTWKVSLLRRFHGQLHKTIRSWEAFAANELQFFEVDSEILGNRWEEYAANIFSDVSELQDMRISLEQWIQSFDREKDDLVSASSLRESRYATAQSQYIRLLTIITVIYLPLSLASGIFSMSMINGDDPLCPSSTTVVHKGSVSARIGLTKNLWRPALSPFQKTHKRETFRVILSGWLWCTHFHRLIVGYMYNMNIFDGRSFGNARRTNPAPSCTIEFPNRSSVNASNSHGLDSNALD
ncbi:MAG: hypothetical protein Q9227_002482 [Pyrenula ochraceoflavens]